MSPMRVLDTLETERLTLRQRTVSEAAIYRQLWTERDLRVPPHRRINLEGRPTYESWERQHFGYSQYRRVHRLVDVKEIARLENEQE